MSTKANNNLEKLDVRILSCRYWNKDSNYGVYEVEFLGTKSRDEGAIAIAADDVGTINGNFEKRFHYGEEFIMYGEQKRHPKYGLQWIISIVQHKMDTPDRIKSFLYQFASPSIIDQLLAKYDGEDIIKRIVDGNIDYSDIKGMKEIRFQALREKVMENEYMKDIIVGLSKYGITPSQMKKLIERFGANAIAKIEENPYHLCKLNGIGFLKADEIAQNMGFDLESPHRIRECIRYILNEAKMQGHSWLSEREVNTQAYDLLKIRPELIQREIDNTRDLVTEEGENGEKIKHYIEDVVVTDGRLALFKVYESERYIADWLKEHNQNTTPLNFDPEQTIKEFEEGDGVVFTDEQKQFFFNLQKFGVNFLIGYAGCGKSYMLKFALRIFDKLNMSVLLCAPTGKAAKVMEQYTGRKASTVHRAFGIFGKSVDDDEISEAQKGAEEDVVVMDETSMLDVEVLSRALQGISNPNARIIFIGDDFQLPSVGVGNFLHDSIESGVFNITKLTKVFRQNEGGVLHVATEIRHGNCFLDPKASGRIMFGKDMIFHACDPESTADGVISYYKKILAIKDEDGSQKYTPDDIVVLSPTKKGPKGTRALNSRIQALVNPPAAHKVEVKYGLETTFRVGDRIINTQNNYKAINVFGEETTVFNGDMGVITAIDRDPRSEDNKRYVEIDYGFDKILTPFDSLGTIIHSYALTIHKSQGSGFKVVIGVTDSSHTWQLNANLIYTGVTRTQQYCVLLGQPDTVNKAIRKNQTIKRNSFLKELLQEKESVVA